MDNAPNRPLYAPTVNTFAVVSVSVSSSTSAAAVGVGPFRGLYFITTSSVTIVGINGNSMALDAIQKNTMLWIQGSYLSVIATATSQYMIL